MGKGMKSGWNFGAEHGFSGSAGKTMVKGYARGGPVKNETGKAGKLGPDLDVKFPGNHLAYKKGGPVKLARGGMGRAMGMPKAPVIGMKRMRHPQGMPGAAGAPPTVPGLPAAGTAPMGVPGAPGSPPRVMAKGGKSRC